MRTKYVYGTKKGDEKTTDILLNAWNITNAKKYSDDTFPNQKTRMKQIIENILFSILLIAILISAIVGILFLILAFIEGAVL